MNLVFYSDGQAAENGLLNQVLLRLPGSSKKLTFFCSTYRGSKYYFESYKEYIRPYGFEDFFNFAADKKFSEKDLETVFSSDVIFLSGGNTFYFLKTLREKKLLERLHDYVRRGGVLLGESAGGIIMTPRIDLAGLVPSESDPNDVELKDLNGLGLVDFEIFPHFMQSAESEKHLIRYSKKRKNPIYAFPDGSGIAIRDGVKEFVGKVHVFFKGISYTM